MPTIALGLAPPTNAQEPRGEWTFSIGVRESRQFNDFVNGEPREDRITDGISTSIGYSTSTERSRYGFFGRVGSNFQRKPDDDRDRLNFGVGLSWDHQSSERFRSLLSGSVNRNFQLSTISELGVVAPDLETTTANLSWSGQYQSGPRTRLSTGAFYSVTDFQTDRAVTGSQLVLDDAPFVDELRTPGDLFEEDELLVPDAEDDVLGILATEGVIDRDSKSQTAGAFLGLNHRISERTTFGANINGGYRSIDRSVSREGAEAAASVFVSRAVGSSTTLGANYRIRHSLAIDPTTTIQTAFGEINYSPSQKDLSFQLAGGMSHFRGEGSPTRTTPVANVSLSAGLTPSTRGFASYRRQFSQSTGFGRTLLIDYVNAGLSQAIGSRLDLGVFAGATFGEDPLVEESQQDARRVGANLSFRVVGGLRIGTSYSYLETENAFGENVTDAARNVWSVFVNYSTSWH